MFRQATGGYGFEDFFGSMFGGGQTRRRANQPMQGEDHYRQMAIDFMDSVHGKTETVTLDVEEPCEHCHGSGAESPEDIEQGEDHYRQMAIDFMDSVHGKTETVTLDVEEPCEHCHGSGAESPEDIETCSKCHEHCHGSGAESPEDIETCSKCHGSGRVVQSVNTFFGTMQQQSVCDRCGGTGKVSGAESPEDIETCSKCHGSGRVVQSVNTFFGTMQQQSVCDRCGGTGKVVKERCHECHGQGHVRKKVKLDIKIPQGIQSGQQIRIPGKGGPGENGGPNGDLYIEIMVREAGYQDPAGHPVRSADPDPRQRRSGRKRRPQRRSVYRDHGASRCAVQARGQ